MSRGTWHYFHKPRPGIPDPKPHKHRVASAWLDADETTTIRQALESSTDSVYETYVKAWDAGCPVASLSTWHRVARATGRPCKTRRKATLRSTQIPQLAAEAPVDVWSWDITKLPGRYRGDTYEFYVVIDIFSRMIVGYRVEEVESDEMARDMMRTATDKHGIPRVVHSDGGPSMMSKTVAQFYIDLGITRSKNRPRVSNDNPYSESAFKTAKYAYPMPDSFASLTAAQAWAEEFVQWYNHDHRHSWLEGHTPASVHDGSWIDVHRARQECVDELYAAHPQRYPRRPVVRAPSAGATINQPKPELRLQTD